MELLPSPPPPPPPPPIIVPPFISIPVLAPTLPLQIKSPPLIAAPKQDPAFFSITTFPAIKFSAHDQPTLPLILTIGPSQDPIPKYPKLPSKIKFSLFKIPTPRLCLP